LPTQHISWKIAGQSCNFNSRKIKKPPVSTWLSRAAIISSNLSQGYGFFINPQQRLVVPLFQTMDLDAQLLVKEVHYRTAKSFS
jgi:hypothetical protein